MPRRSLVSCSMSCSGTSNTAWAGGSAGKCRSNTASPHARAVTLGDALDTHQVKALAPQPRRTIMAAIHASKSAAVHARLNHPVIDSDGHTVEFLPAVLDYLEQIGGTKVFEQ